MTSLITTIRDNIRSSRRFSISPNRLFAVWTEQEGGAEREPTPEGMETS